MAPPRVGLFGLLGSGNFGNDASMEVVLDFLRRRRPDVVVDAMCMGPGQVRRRYGIDAVALQWSRQYFEDRSRLGVAALRAVGKLVDPVRTLRWVGRHDLVVVPGMGVLDTSLPLRASGTPYAVLLLGLSGWLTGTDVAFVCVGASPTSQRLVGRFFDTGARLATYRSFRDERSCHTLHARGVDTSRDHVYADLVFAQDHTDAPLGDDRAVMVGVMAYHGGRDDRAAAEEVHRRYLDTMTSFVVWLLDGGYRVRLVGGDAVDRPAVAAVRSAVQRARPGQSSALLAVLELDSLAEVQREIEGVGTVVGIRLHTVLSALQQCKPTLSIGYAPKHEDLLAQMDMSEFGVPVTTLDVDTLVERFGALRARSAEVHERLRRRNALQRRKLDGQFEDLSALLTARRVPRRKKRQEEPAERTDATATAPT